MSATANFQAWLIKARKNAKLSYSQLAEKSGLSPGSIHGLEHGPGSPSLDTVEKLCKALGTSVEASLRVRNKKPAVDAGTTNEPTTVPVINNHTPSNADSDPAADS